MSAGQVVGGVVGGAIGFFMGNPMMGFQIGMSLGGMLDPPDAPKVEGPRVTDLTHQTSTYGANIPRCYGTIPVMGNLFWLENNKIEERSETSGGGGGKGGGPPEPEQTTYSYFGTFAVGVCKGPIIGVRRIWIGPKLVYDTASDDISTIVASNMAAQAFQIYVGNDTQTADPRMQATLGAANVSAHRGLAYIVFYDLPLAEFNNSLTGASVKVEVVTAASVLGPRRLLAVPDTGVDFSSQVAFGFGDPDVIGFNDGVLRVTTSKWGSHGSTADYTKVYNFDINGRHLSNSTRTEDDVYPGPKATSTPTVLNDVTLPIGIVGGEPVRAYDGLENYAIGSLDVGYGRRPLIMAGNQNGGAFWNVGITDLTTVLPDGEFLFTVGYGENHVWCTTSPTLGGLRTKWYLIEYTGDEPVLVRSGTLQPSAQAGLERPSSRRPKLENDVKHIWTTSGSSLQEVWCFSMDDDGVLRVVAHLDKVSNTAGGGDPQMGFWAQDGWCAVFNVSSYDLYTRLDKLTPAPATLASIVLAESVQSNLLTSLDFNVTSLAGIDVRGYKVTNTAAIRGAIEPLRAAWPFDVVQSGYQVKFVLRGGASVATIPSTLLDARAAGDKRGVVIENDREMDTVLPFRVNIKYLDVVREYDQGEQYAERLNTSSIHKLELEMAIAFNATEAVQKAEVLLYLYWMERYDVKFSLPPGYQHLQPGDVITITTDDATYQLRLTAVNYTSDGRLECKAKYNRSATYSPAAIGVEGESTGQVISLAGPSLYEILDIPLVNDLMDTPGVPVAMTGYLPDWNGGTLMSSSDAGATWLAQQGFTPPGALIAYGTNALTTHTGSMIDKASVLTVRVGEGAELSSVTEAQMLNGANHFAYGANGRWEIIAAQTCSFQGDDHYLLSDLLRGRFGTEWATELHVAEDLLIKLDYSALRFLTLTSSLIGAERHYRAISSGRSIDSDGSRAFTYNGVNLECLSPVYVNGARNLPSTNDWTFNWTRRTRLGGEWRDFVDATLSETSEAYVVEIYSGADYLTLKRTISATTATAVYTSAQQVTDFGVVQAVLYIKVYQVSTTVGNGYAATTKLPQASYGAHIYWRLTTFTVGGGTHLEPTCLNLYEFNVNLTPLAVKTSSVASGGDLANVFSPSLTDTARWTEAEAENPTFWIKWDFSAVGAKIVTGLQQALQVGSGSNRHIAACTLEYSDDNVNWFAVSAVSGITQPTQGVLSMIYKF
jgi:hypothetical protein